MKFSPFRYYRPDTVSEVVKLLVAHGGDALPLAGGQSLLPMMAFRLVQPGALVDLSCISGLDGIELREDGLRLGALVRWCDVLGTPVIARAHPLLVEAVGHVAHYQVRNRGTLGGSIAHADAAAEFPAICLVSDAQIEVIGSQGRRRVSSRNFLLGAMSTDLAEDELVEAIHFPPWPAGRCWSFREFARRKGDFALAGVAMYCDPDAAGGRCQNWRIVCFGLGGVALRLEGVEALLEGQKITADHISAAVSLAQRHLVADGDIHAPPEYRKALAAELLGRALGDILKQVGNDRG